MIDIEDLPVVTPELFFADALYCPGPDSCLDWHKSPGVCRCCSRLCCACWLCNDDPGLCLDCWALQEGVATE